MPNLTGNKWGASQTFGTSGGVVTWSVVGAGVDLSAAGSSVPGTISAIPGGSLSFDWLSVIREAFDDWSSHGNLEFMQIEDDGAPTDSGSDATIRIAFTPTAPFWGFGFFPGTGDRAGDVFIDTRPFTEVNFKTLMLHELGHAIGLDHVSTFAIMQTPFVTTTLQSDDILGIKQKYGTQDGAPSVFTLDPGEADLTYLDVPDMLTVNGNALANRIEDISQGNTTINGLGGADTLIGGFGNSVIDGGEGNDTLISERGNDTLIGGIGNDTLTALDPGRRQEFVLTPGGGTDVISHFDLGMDTLNLDALGLSAAQITAAYNNSVDTAFGVRVDFGGGVIVTLGSVTHGEVANFPPTVTVPDQTAAHSTAFRLVDVWSVVDPNIGDTVQAVQLWDSEGGNNWRVNGVFVDASSGHTATTPNNVYFHTDSTGSSTQTLHVRAFDGKNWGDWDAFQLTTEMPNQSPSASVPEQFRFVGEWVRLLDVMTYSDPDGDPLAQVLLWDTAGIDNWRVNGVIVDASSPVTVDAADAGEIFFRADAAPGQSIVSVNVSDGTALSGWNGFRINTAAENALPVATVDDLARDPGQWVRLSTVLNYSDGNGHEREALQLWDSEGANSWWDGTVVDASSGYSTTSDPFNIWFRAETTPGTQTLHIRANDGYDWGNWDSFEFTSNGPNMAPTVAIADQTATGPGDWTRLSDVMTYNDPDGDALHALQLWDDTGGMNWWADGGLVNASSGYTTTQDPSQIWFRGDAVDTVQTLHVRASDGEDWGAWDSFLLTIA